MPKTDDPAQGFAPANNNPASARKVPEPDGKAIIRAVGAAVSAKDRAVNRPRPPQRVGGLQDWRRG